MNTIVHLTFLVASQVFIYLVLIPISILLNGESFASPTTTALSIGYLTTEILALYLVAITIKYFARRITRKALIRIGVGVGALATLAVWILFIRGFEHERAHWTSKDGRASVRTFQTLSLDMLLPTAIGSGSQVGEGYKAVYCDGWKTFELHDALWVMADQPNRGQINEAVRSCTPQDYFDEEEMFN